MTWYVYQGVNHTAREIYFGVSTDPEARIDGSHCDGGTIALAHWRCGRDRIEWRIVSRHRSQPLASARAHELERTTVVPGYYVIQTGGI